MKKYLAAILTFIMLAGVMSGCGSADQLSAEEPEVQEETEGVQEEPAESSEEAGGGSIKIGMTTMGQASFWDAVASGVREVMKDGDELIFVEGEHGNAAGQVNIVEDFITQECDVVLFNPVDADAASSCLDLLEDAGIPVIVFDSPCTDMSTVESFCATDNHAAGALVADFMMEEHPEGGTVAVLVYESAAACVARVEGFKERLASNDKWTIVTELDGGNTTDAALPVAEDIISAYPDLTCIFSGNDEMALGAYSAITGADLQIGLYSINGGPEAKAKMMEDGEEGVWRATGAQSPIGVGRKSMELAYDYLDGKEIEEEYLIDAFIICPANIEEYGKEEWQ